MLFEVDSSRKLYLTDTNLSLFVEHASDDGIILSENYPNSVAGSYITKTFVSEAAAYKIYITDINMDKADEQTGLYD